MSGDLLQKADWLYQAARTARIDRRSVDHPVVSKFSDQLMRLFRGLGDVDQDSFWVDTLRALFVARLQLFGLPLPLNHSALIAADTMSFLRNNVNRCQYMFPDWATELDAVVSLLEQLRRSEVNPLFSAMGPLLDVNARAAVLVRNSSYILPLESFLAEAALQNVSVLVASHLRPKTNLDQLFVIGPTAWFPTWVFSAPRARHIHLFHYTCVRDEFQLTQVFQQLPGTRPPRLLTIHEQLALAVTAEEVVTVQELSDATLWVLSETHKGSSSDEETVLAHVVLLDGDCAVFLEERTWIDLIDLEADGDVLQRSLIEDVVSGQFLLLRTERGGDHVTAVADRLLGKYAIPYRELQQAWKVRLREEVESRGLFEVAISLLDCGSTCADETNVRNWCSPRNIKTQDRRDFAAIMQLIGWDGREAEIWDTMVRIDSAHRRAGHLIRQQLLEQVRRADLSELDRAGQMGFTLPVAGGGSITAYRVVSRIPDRVSVAVNRLEQPFDQGGHQWQG
jgi:hypothetical protein